MRQKHSRSGPDIPDCVYVASLSAIHSDAGCNPIHIPQICVSRAAYGTLTAHRIAFSGLRQFLFDALVRSAVLGARLLCGIMAAVLRDVHHADRVLGWGLRGDGARVRTSAIRRASRARAPSPPFRETQNYLSLSGDYLLPITDGILWHTMDSVRGAEMKNAQTHLQPVRPCEYVLW